MTRDDRGTSKLKDYQATVRQMVDLLSKGLSPAEMVDYLAVDKAGESTTDWAKVRDVQPQSVSGNVGSARKKINRNRLNAEVIEKTGSVIVRVSDEDNKHELTFEKLSSVMGNESEIELQVIYETHTAVHGYYIDDNEEEEYEATLWYDGRRTNSFEEFDFADDWGSPEAKADTILWEKE